MYTIYLWNVQNILNDIIFDIIHIYCIILQDKFLFKITMLFVKIIMCNV